jgi:hypothetical protein
LATDARDTWDYKDSSGGRLGAGESSIFRYSAIREESENVQDLLIGDAEMTK